MLNIPDSVKALFKQDGVYKNFRAHFPNGELADITNENIVQESVKFTESVCSQDVFKFGLTEASVIEFETVGVANMYGMTIECSCEIDCSSLSSADKADIAAGTWDGTWDGVNAVFSVPYGTFRVESCPRNHEAMAHRKVTAYTQAVNNNSLIRPYLRSKLSTKAKTPQYTFDIGLFSISNLAYFSTDIVNEFGFVASDADNYEIVQYSSDTYRTPLTIKQGNEYYRITINYERRVLRRTANNVSWLSDGLLYNVLLNGDITPAWNYINSLKGKYGEDAPIPLNPWRKWYNAAQDRCGIKIPITFVTYPGGSTSTTNQTALVSALSLYLFGRIDTSANVTITAYFPQEIIVDHTTDNGGTWTTVEQKSFDAIPSDGFSLQKVTPPSSYFPIQISVDPTWSDKANASQSFVDAIDFADMLNGWLEINSLFAKPQRTGPGFKIVELSQVPNVSIMQSEYKGMWFDEYSVEPIGIVRYTYTDEAGEDQIVDYQFGDGASIYDMSDNACLKLMDGANQTTIEALLDASFVPDLASVNFVPIDLNMKGLPYLEAGDALSVTAQDGTVCNSYALRQEISGVQVLEAQIDSQSGLIIESEAAT